jgi:hypothetical protein
MLAQIWEGTAMVPARVGQGISGLLTHTSPVGLIATGVAVGLLVSPGLRKGARRFLVGGTKVGLTAQEKVKSNVLQVKQGWQDILAEARTKEQKNVNPAPIVSIAEND